MISYAAKIIYSREDSAWLVEFPDLPGCLTYGSSRQQALDRAKEALDGYLESIDLREMEIPRPAKRTGRNFHQIEPSENIAFAIWLKLTRKKNHLTQKQLAARLNIPYQNVQNFENPRKANPTLKTIAKLQAVLGEQILRF